MVKKLSRLVSGKNRAAAPVALTPAQCTKVANRVFALLRHDARLAHERRRLSAKRPLRHW